MIKEYTIKDLDTVQLIAYLFYGDASEWPKIVRFNNLDYPYITNDQNFKTKIKASGMVTFYRVDNPIITYQTYNDEDLVDDTRELDDSYTIDDAEEFSKFFMGYLFGLNDYPAYDEITIPQGTLVNVSGTGKQYKTVTEAKILSGSDSVDVLVECVFPGMWGNVGAGAINEIDPSTPVTNVKVTNATAFTNGAIYNVKKTGEKILIPVDIEDTRAVTRENYLDILGGEDLMLFDTGDLDGDVYGDLASVSGIMNIAYRIKHRLETERGELVYHPEYGSNLAKLIARNEPFIDKMIQLEIMETIMQDFAVEKVEILKMVKSSDKLYVKCNIQLVNQEIAQTIGFNLFAA